MLTAVILQVIVGVFLLIHAAITYECAPGYDIYNNTCYKNHTTCKTWQEAGNTCHSEGGFLFSVKDLMTYNLAKERVKQIAASKVLCEGGLWVGGRQQEVSGSRFYWDVDNSTVNKDQYFAPNEPSTNEGCIEIRHALNDRLNSHDCSIKKDFLCQGCYLIDHCDIIKCPTPDDTYCEECENFYKLTQNRTQCVALPAANNTTNVGLIVGLIFVFIVAVIIASILYYCRRKRMCIWNTEAVTNNDEMTNAASSGNKRNTDQVGKTELQEKKGNGSDTTDKNNQVIHGNKSMSQSSGSTALQKKEGNGSDTTNENTHAMSMQLTVEERFEQKIHIRTQEFHRIN